MKSFFLQFSGGIKYFYLIVLLIVMGCSHFTGKQDNAQPKNTFIPDTIWTPTGVPLLDSLLQLAATAPLDTNLAKLYHQIGGVYENYDYEKAKEYFIKLGNLSDQLGWRKGRYLYAGGLSGILTRQGYIDSAILVNQQALELAKEEKNENRIAIISMNMGISYSQKKWLNMALEHYMTALTYYEPLNDEGKLGHLYYLMCGLFNTMNLADKAIEYGEKALVLNKNVPLQYILSDLANAYSKAYQYDKANLYFEEALEICKSQNNIYLMEGIYYCLGRNAIEVFDLEKAEYYFQQLQEIKQQTGNNDDVNTILILSKIELFKGNYDKSEALAMKAMQLIEERDDPFAKNLGYRILSELSVVQRKYRENQQYWVEGDKVARAIANENFESATAEMAAKYEAEKKELKISALEERQHFILLLFISLGVVLALALATLFFLWRWTVQKRQLAETRIVQLEKEKQLIATQALLDGETRERSRLARDLHDGLGSILTGAKLNLLEMKKGAVIAGDTLERYDAAVGMLDQSLSEMRRVAHHLMPEALSAVGLKQSTADFVASIPNATFSYYGDETRFDTKLEETIYRITHELVTNALKHSGAEQILVDIFRYDNHITLAVQDDGCGFDPDAETNGMGVSNIRTRIDAFGGNLTIVSKAGVGTEVNVEFLIS